MARPHIAFVTTANAAIGTGHLRRCLTLSDELRAAGGTVTYWVYDGDPQVRGWLDGRCEGATVERTLGLDEAVSRAAAASMVVVDTYDAGSRELGALTASGARVLVMDDLADRALPATWLLNSCLRDPSAYGGLTGAELLLGPSYALLRPQFRGLPPREVRGRVERVLLSFGGSDPLGLAARVLALLEDRPGPLDLCVVAGLLAEDRPQALRRHRVAWRRDVQDMADLMRWADVAITASGQTVFELAACGCPALCLQVADNQRHTGDLVAALGTALVRDARSAGDGDLAADLDRLWSDAGLRGAMSRAGTAAVDGQGARRVCGVMMANRR